VRLIEATHLTLTYLEAGSEFSGYWCSLTQQESPPLEFPVLTDVAVADYWIRVAKYHNWILR